MNTGERIRKYRKMRHMTQQELGEAVGLSSPAIRNYELGNREPGKEQIEAIAKALKVAPSALSEYDVKSARDALELLFRVEEAFGLTPANDDTLTIDHKAKGAQKLSAAIRAWRSVLDQVDSGEMTSDEYEEWKASFKA